MNRKSMMGSRRRRQRRLKMESLERRALLAALTLNDGAAATNTRLVEAEFSEVAENPIDVRFKLNGAQYGEWQSYAGTMAVNIPSFQGVNWVSSEIRYADGSIDFAYDSIAYVRPGLQLNDSAEKTNSREVRVSFDNIVEDVAGVRFKFNSSEYGELQSYSDPITVTIPSWQGTNWVSSQIEFADGSTATAYDSIEYVRPTIEINDNASLTNSRSVFVSFNDIVEPVASVRFKINGSAFGGMPQEYSDSMPVRVSGLQGTNWVSADIQFAGGSTVFAYDSIEYRRAAFRVNGGAEITNSRLVQADFSNVTEDAVAVRFSMNGRAYQDWQPFADAMQVTIPSWPGTNWVNSEIRYADDTSTIVYDSIRYQRPKIELADNDKVTNSRDVNVTFKNVTSNAEKVRFKFGGGQYGDWLDFTETTTVTLPNWKGTNWVNSEIAYSVGGNAIAYDSIDYLPSVLISGEGGITFALNIQDSEGEGFRDPKLGQQRVAAASHALGIWADHIEANYDGERIEIEAKIDSMRQGVLGGAKSLDFETLTDQFGNSSYGSTLANHLSERDIDSSSSEVLMIFNSAINWYYGTDGKGGSTRYDFVTLVLHEIGHGLNLTKRIYGDGVWRDEAPGIYERFLENEAAESIASMSQEERAAAVKSDDVHWGGAKGVVGNDGKRPRIYAPAEWKSGSSLSHLNKTHHGDELMRHSFLPGTADHSPGPISLGMLADLGWSIVGMADTEDAQVQYAMVEPTFSTVGNVQRASGRRLVVSNGDFDVTSTTPNPAAGATAMLDRYYMSVRSRSAQTAVQLPAVGTAVIQRPTRTTSNAAWRLPTRDRGTTRLATPAVDQVWSDAGATTELVASSKAWQNFRARFMKGS